MDIVIYDNWFTPLIFNQNGFFYIPAEGVYAVFEVKPDIQGSIGDKSYIEYAGEKIASVRVLKREATNFINVGTKYPPRPLTKIVGGILCSTNSFTHQNNDTIAKHLQTLYNLKSIDLGCIADYGSFYIDYNPFEEITTIGQDAYLEFYSKRKINKIKFSNTDHSFITFFMQLTRYLQQAIGTIPAINLNTYLKNIGEEVDEQI